MLSGDDILDIYQVLNKVHHLLDNHAFDTLDEVFCDDAVYDLSYRKLPEVRGLAAMRVLMRESLTRDKSDLLAHHLTNNYVYEDSEGRVHARSKVVVVYVGGRTSCSEYHDIVVKTPAGWRIQRRVASSRDKSAINATRPVAGSP